MRKRNGISKSIKRNETETAADERETKIVYKNQNKTESEEKNVQDFLVCL